MARNRNEQIEKSGAVAEGKSQAGQSGKPPAVPFGRGREALGILLLSLSLFIGLSVASLQFGSGTLMGPCGAAVGLGAYALIGIGAYLAAGALLDSAVRLLRNRPARLRSIETLAYVCGAAFASVLLHLS